MRSIVPVILILCLMPLASFAQKKAALPYNEGAAPKVVVYLVGKDSLQHLKTLKKDKENKIKIVLEGGMEKIKHEIFVTSKNAEIRKNPSAPQQYIVIPHEENCEIIVDVKTEELYYAVQFVDKKGKKVKQIAREYPPKTYMVSYERYEVK